MQAVVYPRTSIKLLQVGLRTKEVLAASAFSTAKGLQLSCACYVHETLQSNLLVPPQVPMGGLDWYGALVEFEVGSYRTTSRWLFRNLVGIE